MTRVLALGIIGLLLVGCGIAARQGAAEQTPEGIWVQGFQRLELAADGTGSQVALPSGPNPMPLRWEIAAPDTIHMEIQWADSHRQSLIDGTWRIENDQLVITEAGNQTHRYNRWHDASPLTSPDEIRAGLVGNTWRTPYNVAVDELMEFAPDGTVVTWRSHGSDPKDYGTWQLDDSVIIIVINTIRAEAVLVGGSQLQIEYPPHGAQLRYHGVPKP